MFTSNKHWPDPIVMSRLDSLGKDIQDLGTLLNETSRRVKDVEDYLGRTFDCSVPYSAPVTTFKGSYRLEQLSKQFVKLVEYLWLVYELVPPSEGYKKLEK